MVDARDVLVDCRLGQSVDLDDDEPWLERWRGSCWRGAENRTDEKRESDGDRRGTLSHHGATVSGSVKAGHPWPAGARDAEPGS